MAGSEEIFQRTDIRLQNDRGLTLECSHWEPEQRKQEQMPCVIFLHGNCSSRIEGMELLVHLLPLGITVFCFDFSGSGLSGGEYVSLSYFEKEDLKVVVKHLRSAGTVSGIGLWGRSMGAATAVFHAAADAKIHACVLDSPFSDLKKVAEELVDRGRFRVPGFLLSMALELIRSEVQSRAHFDLLKCMPVEQAHQATCPALFAHAYDDNFVLPHHTRDIYEIWGGRAEFVDFDGGHNGERPAWFMKKACEFLQKSLDNPREAPIRGSKRRNGLPASPASLPKDEIAAAPPAPLSTPAATALRDKVVEMGFGDDVATAAAHRCSSVEACVDWIMAQFQDAIDRVEGPGPRAPSIGMSLQPNVGDSAPVLVPPPPATSTSPTKVDVETELVKLGFAANDAAEAAKRCSTVEAGLEWVLRQGPPGGS